MYGSLLKQFNHQDCVCNTDLNTNATITVSIINNLFQPGAYNPQGSTILVVPRSTGAFGCNGKAGSFNHVCPQPITIQQNEERSFSFNSHSHCINFAIEVPSGSGSWSYVLLKNVIGGELPSYIRIGARELILEGSNRDPIGPFGICI